MKLRASELSSAAILSDGSLSIGFHSTTDSHALELSRKAQEQLLPALLASEPADLQKFFPVADVQSNLLAEGMLLTFTIKQGIVVRVLLPTAVHQKLQGQMHSLAPPP